MKNRYEDKYYKDNSVQAHNRHKDHGDCLYNRTHKDTTPPKPEYHVPGDPLNMNNFTAYDWEVYDENMRIWDDEPAQRRRKSALNTSLYKEINGKKVLNRTPSFREIDYMTEEERKEFQKYAGEKLRRDLIALLIVVLICVLLVILGK